MREALENARSKFIHIKKCVDEGEVSRKKLAILCDFVSREITAALAAPPRNCDVGIDWLQDFYANFRPPKGMREMPPEWVDAISAFCRWLVAPAKQEKVSTK